MALFAKAKIETAKWAAVRLVKSMTEFLQGDARQSAKSTFLQKKGNQNSGLNIVYIVGLAFSLYTRRKVDATILVSGQYFSFFTSPTLLAPSGQSPRSQGHLTF